MKKNKDIILFVLLVVAIIVLVIIASNKHKVNGEVDRKVELVFGYSYGSVLSKSEELFFNTISIVNNTIYNYEYNTDNTLKKYSINGKSNYKKILNKDVIENNINKKDITKYLNNNKIVSYNNEYYIEDYKLDTIDNYVGSTLEIIKQEDNIAYVKSKNYYCDNSKYIGKLDEIPSNCEEKDMTFSIVYEDNQIKINNISDFIKDRIY